MPETRVTLNDGRFNAAILGFIHVLNETKIPWQVENDRTLVFNTDGLWPKFTEAYFNLLVRRYETTTRAHRIIEILNKILMYPNKIGDDFTNALKEAMTDIEKAATSSSYTKVWETIQNRYGETYAFENNMKTANKLVKNKKATKDDYDKVLAMLDEFRSYFTRYKRRFVISDIAYNIIQPYWGAAPKGPGVVFNQLKPAKNFFDECYDKTFIKPMSIKPTSRNTCSYCGQTVDSDDKLSFISDLGIDASKKHNSFWNYINTTRICPMCRLIYTCLPLGFTMTYREGIFINASGSIQTIMQDNQTIWNASEHNSFAQILSSFLVAAATTESRKFIENTQVIRRIRKPDGDGWYYKLDILDRSTMEALITCKDEMTYIMKHPVYLDDKRESDIHSVLTEVINGRSLLPYCENLSQKFLRSKTWNGNMYTCKEILYMYIKLTKEREGTTMANLTKHVNWAVIEGFKLKKLIDSRRNESKNISLSYRLLAAVQANDVDMFIQTVSRQYISLEQPIPAVFIEARRNPDAFPAIGEAFIIGLNKTDPQENNNAADAATTTIITEKETT